MQQPKNGIAWPYNNHKNGIDALENTHNFEK